MKIFFGGAQWAISSMEAPNAAEPVRIGALGPFRFKLFQRFGRLEAVPDS